MCPQTSLEHRVFKTPYPQFLFLVTNFQVQERSIHHAVITVLEKQVYQS